MLVASSVTLPSAGGVTVAPAETGCRGSALSLSPGAVPAFLPGARQSTTLVLTLECQERSRCVEVSHTTGQIGAYAVSLFLDHHLWRLRACTRQIHDDLFADRLVRSAQDLMTPACRRAGRVERRLEDLERPTRDLDPNLG